MVLNTDVGMVFFDITVTDGTTGTFLVEGRYCFGTQGASIAGLIFDAVGADPDSDTDGHTDLEELVLAQGDYQIYPTVRGDGLVCHKNDGPAGRFGMIENIDGNFGRMMQKLEEWGALDNTLIIFMTDNGMSHVEGKKNGKVTPFYTADLRGKKCTPYEGGTRVPAFWYWKGVLGEGVDVEALTAHIDIYKTFSELVGAELPAQMQELDGRSLLPLLKDPKAEWADREFFVHVGRWEAKHPKAKDVPSAKFVNCAVRTERWRFVNNAELYDISADPGETKDVSTSYPEVVAQIRKSYDAWWDKTVPLMVNEGLTTQRIQRNYPLAVRYREQLKEGDSPEWSPENL